MRIKAVKAVASIEMFKISKQLRYKVFLVISLAIVSLGAFFMKSVLSAPIGNYPFTALSIAGYGLGPFAAFMLAADLVASEFYEDRIKLLASRPLEREEIWLGKALSMAAYLLIVYFCAFLASSIVSAFQGGLGAFSLSKAFMAYLVGSLAILPHVALSMLMASFARSAASSFSLCILAYMGLFIVALWFPHMSPAVFTTYIGIGAMAIGTYLPVGNFLFGLGVLYSYALLMLSLGAMLFSRASF